MKYFVKCHLLPLKKKKKESRFFHSCNDITFIFILNSYLKIVTNILVSLLSVHQSSHIIRLKVKYMHSHTQVNLNISPGNLVLYGYVR